MTFDPKDGYLVLFGGCQFTHTGCAVPNVTWTFSHGAWSKIATGQRPAGRWDASMAFDAADGYVVLFGGASGSVPPFNDTWTFSNGTWTRLAPPVSPTARSGASMTYDAKDGYLLLFGGDPAPLFPSSHYLNDTWKFSKGTWTNITPKVSPAPRSGASIAYDRADGYAVMLGGSCKPTCWSNETWKFVGQRWVNDTVGASPPGRDRANLVYDSGSGYLVLFGGASSTRTLNDTWKFLGGSWTNMTSASAPPARWGAAMACDTRVGIVILFGGAQLLGPSGYLADQWRLG